MKVMIYGFEPYGSMQENISQKIVEALTNRFKTFVFPVKFSKKQFLDVLKAENPDVIVGLGQHPRARKVRLERIAKNLYGTKAKKILSITSNGKERLTVNLKLKPARNMRVSYSAGTFVCNYSMYIFQEWADMNRKKFAFMHIPKSTDPNEVVSYLSKFVKTIK